MSAPLSPSPAQRSGWCSDIWRCLLQIEQYLESQQQGDAEVKAEEEKNEDEESGAEEEEEEEPEPK